MPHQAVRNKIRDRSLMKRGLIEEQGKGGSEACCCLIQWDAPGAWRLAYFNCTSLSFIKGSMQRYCLNESERKAGYSVSFSHTHRRIMWLCWLGPHVLAQHCCLQMPATHTHVHTHWRATCVLSLREDTQSFRQFTGSVEWCYSC